MNENHKSKAPSRFVPLHAHHIIALDGLSPANLKWSASHVIEDREPLEINTALQFLVKRLGVNGGFGEYKRQYQDLQRFMTAHGLITRQDLITPRNGLAIISLKPRQVADRLFLPNKSLPERLFTGYNVDWDDINTRWYQNNPWRDHPQAETGFIPYQTVINDIQDDLSAVGETDPPAVEIRDFKLTHLEGGRKAAISPEWRRMCSLYGEQTQGARTGNDIKFGHAGLGHPADSTGTPT